MKPKVYFAPATSKDYLKTIHAKIMDLYKEAEFSQCFEAGDLIGIKIHFGEKGNTTHIPADYLKPLVTEMIKKQGRPFITDTCVLYKSHRSDAVTHLLLAEDHGFTLRNCGAPVIIADGLRGRNEIEVEIPGKIFTKVSIASEAVIANSLFVVSHVTGHLATSLGAALKNIGMGFASRKGKLRQHSAMKPKINDKKCTGCEECVEWCPENAIRMAGNTAKIDGKLCIGCGECLTVCRFDAVQYDWKTSGDDLQKKVAEHALGAVFNKRDKTCYFNFLFNVTKDCDCFGIVQTPVIDDIGILASRDPVAIDKASLDLIEQKSGKSLPELSYPGLDPLVQINHAQEIGLGESSYELVTIA